jgi:hypothetical protein
MWMLGIERKGSTVWVGPFDRSGTAIEFGETVKIDHPEARTKLRLLIPPPLYGAATYSEEIQR